MKQVISWLSSFPFFKWVCQSVSQSVSQSFCSLVFLSVRKFEFTCTYDCLTYYDNIGFDKSECATSPIFNLNFIKLISTVTTFPSFTSNRRGQTWVSKKIHISVRTKILWQNTRFRIIMIILKITLSIEINSTSSMV